MMTAEGYRVVVCGSDHLFVEVDDAAEGKICPICVGLELRADVDRLEAACTNLVRDAEDHAAREEQAEAQLGEAVGLLRELLRNFTPEHLDSVAGADFGTRCWAALASLTEKGATDGTTEGLPETPDMGPAKDRMLAAGHVVAGMPDQPCERVSVCCEKRPAIMYPTRCSDPSCGGENGFKCNHHGCPWPVEGPCPEGAKTG